MIDKNHFIKCLLHKWDNLHQAQCQPNQFAHVHYDWFLNHNGILSSKQWYHWNGETYRERTHWLSQYPGEDKLQLLIVESNITIEFTESEAGVYVGKTDGQVDSNGVLYLLHLFLSIHNSDQWINFPICWYITGII